MHNHSYRNEFSLHVNEISFSCERMGTQTRLENEAIGHSEIASFTLFFLLRQLIKFSNQSSCYSSDPARKVVYSIKWEIVFFSRQKHLHSSKTTQATY